MEPVRTTVLISGSGSNLQALIDASTAKGGPLEGVISVVRVLSNRAGAKGLDRAGQAGIPTGSLSLVKARKEVEAEQAEQAEGAEQAAAAPMSKAEISRTARARFDGQLAEAVLADGPALVVCAGFMHILSAVFLERVGRAGVRVINLHPALPGEFNGVGAIERAHARWRAAAEAPEGSAERDAEGRWARTGVMVHEVVEEVDMGRPVLTREIVFEQGDEELARFEERLHRIEWGVIVEATRMVAEEIRK